jgi:hypothetical protein
MFLFIFLSSFFWRRRRCRGRNLIVFLLWAGGCERAARHAGLFFLVWMIWVVFWFAKEHRARNTRFGEERANRWRRRTAPKTKEAATDRKTDGACRGVLEGKQKKHKRRGCGRNL